MAGQFKFPMKRKIHDTIPKEDVNFVHNNIPLRKLALDELFEYLEIHILEFEDLGNFDAVVPFIRGSLEQWSKNCNNLNCDIGLTLFYFLEQQKNEEQNVICMVHIINQVLQSLKSGNDCDNDEGDDRKEKTLTEKVFSKLTHLLPTSPSTRSASAIINFIQLYIGMFPDKGHDIIENLWCELSVPSPNVDPYPEINIFIQFYDEFYKMKENIADGPGMIAVITKLLRSEQKDERKDGQYLLRKIIQNLLKQLQNWRGGFEPTSINYYYIRQYINIISRNLEEEASSDLIINDLNKLKEVIQRQRLPIYWVEELSMRLLSHNNMDFVNWTMEFLLGTYTFSDLCLELVEEILKTSNSPLFYSHEGYFLKTELFQKFLKGNLTKLFEIMGNIPWKSLPLYVWINTLYENEEELPSTLITYEELLKLSARVQDLEKGPLHDKIAEIFEELFKKTINLMSMKDYIKFVELLFINTTSSNLFKDFEQFFSKKLDLLKITNEKFMFSQSFYKVIVKNLFKVNEINRLVKFLNDIPKNQHGWLKFLPFLYYERLDLENVQILNKLYGLNTDFLKTRKLSEIIAQFEQYLLIDLPSESLKDCHLAAFSFFIQQKLSFDQIDDETLKIIFSTELSDKNLWQTNPELCLKLCLCLENTNKTLDFTIIDEFLKRISFKDEGDRVLKYICKTYDEATKKKYFEIILEKYIHKFYEKFNNYVNPLKLANQTHFVTSDPKKNKDWIEPLLFYNKFDEYEANTCNFISDLWWNGLIRYCDEEYILYLLNYHKQLTQEYPGYDENSLEYCTKLRISVAICWMRCRKSNIFTNEIFHEIWDILVNEQNHFHICYIYEAITVSQPLSEDTILEKLEICQNLTSKSQIYTISQVYNHCMRNSLENIKTKQKIVSNLIELSSCDIPETQKIAQICLYKLLKSENFQNILIRNQNLQSVEIMLHPKLNERLNDIRWYMHEDELWTEMHKVILFLIQPPLDYFSMALHSNSTKFLEKFSPRIQNQLIKCRELFLKENKKQKNTLKVN